MAWEKGQSGNPGGRPKRDREVRELAREYTKDALGVLVAIARNGQSEAARVTAANTLLCFGWGRPPQALTGHDGGPIRHIHEIIPDDLTKLSDAELYKLSQDAFGALRH